MSFLRSKHFGWTWEGKRTPFGNGGGSWNPISAITDPISSVIGTDGSGGGVLGELANIDPGPAIGSGLAEADTFVNRELPGGWALPAIVTAAVLAPELAPELLTATEGAEGALTTSEILGSSGFVPTAGSSFVVDPALAYTAAGAGGAGALSGLAGPTYAELGYTGLGEGMAGPTYAELGYTGLNNAEAIAAADAAAKTGLSASEILSNANRLRNIAKLLTGSESSPIFSKNTPTASQWAQQAAQNFAQYTPEQFGGYYQMNKNPFTFQNPLANALKGSTTGLDVSGTGGQTLNTQGQASNLAKLLA